MGKSYPSFHPSYSHEDLVEHFLLTPSELELVLKCRGDANRCGIALLLKTLPHLGYVPNCLGVIPTEVREFVAGQIGLLWDCSESYPWHSSTFDYHLAQVRESTGWRFATTTDKDALECWLRQHGAYQAHTEELLLAAACRRLRLLRIELPAQGELERVASAALIGFYQDVHRRIADGASSNTRTQIDELLKVIEPASISVFERLKSDPGKPGVDNLNVEIGKIQIIRTVDIRRELFLDLSFKVLQLLKRRAANETATEMREHSDFIRYGLMGCSLYVRSTEATDDIARMAVDLIQRLDKRSETQIFRELLADVARVEGKMQILSRVAEAVVEQPDGIVREVIFPTVKEKTFRDLVAEFRASGPHLRLLRQNVMERKFARHYRRMLPALLNTLEFRSDNRFQPLIQALAAIKRAFGSHHRHFIDDVPLDGIVTPSWHEKVLEEVKGQTKVNRHYYELCVLEKLQRALKCKEVWVEGSLAFRNPSEDMPGDWAEEERRIEHYHALSKPLDGAAFVDDLRTRMRSALN